MQVELVYHRMESDDYEWWNKGMWLESVEAYFVV
jgi:hypothetical protein